MKFFKYILVAIFCLTAILAVVVFLINYNINSSTAHLIYKDVPSLPEADAVLVLGASVYRSGKLSDVLTDRALTAKEVLDGGKASRIIISGDSREGEYDEVLVTKKFLVQSGVDEDIIETDLEGLDTFDSIMHIKERFGLESIIISTQGFHLPRGLYLADKLGIKAYGISADRQAYQRISYFKFREWFANLKAFYETSKLK